VYQREPLKDARHGVPRMQWQPIRVFPPAAAVHQQVSERGIGHG